MKRIVLLSLSKRGAGAGLLKSIAQDLANDGETSVICIVSDELDGLNEFVSNNAKISVIALQTGSKCSFMQNTVKLIFHDRYKIKQKIKNKKIDLFLEIFSHPWAHFIEQVLNCDNYATICHDPKPHSGASIIYTVVSEYAYKKSKNLIVMTRSLASYTSDRFKKDVYYIPLGIFSCYKTGKCESQNKVDKLTFLFFGRIEPYKGLDILLDAFSKIEDKSNIELKIMGSGDITPYESKLNQGCVLIDNRFIGDDEIETIFSDRNSVLILPYKDATQSGVIPIAVDFDMPIIASNTGGLKEQLDDGRIGIFCEPNDSQSLQMAMSLFIDDVNRHDKEVNRMKLFKENLRWKKIIDVLIEDMEHGKPFVSRK